MPMTMTQKILADHAGLPFVEAGQLIEADLDLVLGNDITTPVAIREMDKMNTGSVFDKEVQKGQKDQPDGEDHQGDDAVDPLIKVHIGGDFVDVLLLDGSVHPKDDRRADAQFGEL